MEKLAIVFESPLRRDVEWTIGPPGMQADNAARSDRVADAEFVEDVRVKNRDVGEDKIRCDQFREHVLEDVPGGFLVIGAERL